MIFLRILVVLLALCSSAQAGNVAMLGGGVDSVTTYWADLKLNDNAASTNVVNSGTGGDWTAQSYTSVLHSETTNDGSSGSFYVILSKSNKIVKSPTWNGNSKIIFSMDLKFISATAGGNGNDIVMGISNDNSDNTANEWKIKRVGSSDELQIQARGNADAGSCTVTTSDVAGDTNWHTYVVSIDSTTSPWTISISRDGIYLTFGSWSCNNGAANFNNLKFWFLNEPNYGMAGYVDNFKIY